MKYFLHDMNLCNNTVVKPSTILSLLIQPVFWQKLWEVNAVILTNCYNKI